jgi:hypothetical protein
VERKTHLSSPNFTSYKDITISHLFNISSFQQFQVFNRIQQGSSQLHRQICTSFHDFNCSSVQHKSDETKAIADLFTTLDHYDQVITASLKTLQVKLTLVRNPGREKEYSPDLQFKQVNCSLHASHAENYKNRTQMQQNKSLSCLAALHLHHSRPCFPKDQKHLHLLHFTQLVQIQ